MVIFSVIFISSFCAVQVNNQLSNINTFNLYRARLSAIIVKNSLEKVIKDNSENPSLDLKPFFQVAISSLKDSKVIENALIFDKQCRVIATSGMTGDESKIRPADYRIVDEGTIAIQKEKWFIPNIDQARKIIDLYIPLIKDNGFDYMARISFSLGNIEESLKQVYIPIIITIIIVILANIILGSILTKTIVTPINILNIATKAIAAGDLKRKVDIRTKDEIEELGDTFNFMTEALQKMKERAENANPLTKLPGNNVIHEEITGRINTRKKFVVIYSDLDNFKAFNDKYGIGAGDKAIRMTAEIMSESLKLGGQDSFLGHEGGDDFVLITSPANAEKVAKYITDEFDKRVRVLYNKEDLDQGFIIAHARDGTIQKFPTMTISLAGVSSEIRQLTSYAQITNICAEVKKKAKSIPQSIFVLDRRIDNN